MKGGANTQDEIKSYLVFRGVHFRLAQCTPLLFKELTADLVTAALERLQNGPMPGLDGVPGCMYQHFPDIFVLHMLNSLRGFMAGAVPPDSWTVALVSSIPKQPGVPVVEGLRPISLWDIRFMPTRSVFTFFQTFLNFWRNAPKCRHLGGGMCMLFEICGKTPFQKCMGWGG